MLHEDELIDIDGWNRDHYGDFICEWLYEIDDGELDGKDNWSAFALTVQQQDDNRYEISIAVAFDDGVGDLLSSDYSESCRTVEEAMAIGREFTESVEKEYLN